MTVLYVRVKDKSSGHEFDLPKQSFDPDRYTKVARYPETTRTRRPKLNVLKGGQRKNPAPVETEKE